MKSLLILLILMGPALLYSEEESLYILFSNNCKGQITACDCPSHPSGGLARMKTFIDDFRKKHKNVILVDGGDMYSTVGDRILNKYMSRSIELMKYDAVMVGALEFRTGEKFLVRNAEKIPYTCANIYQKNEKKPLFPSMIKISKGDYSIGIIGMISKTRSSKINSKTIEVKEPLSIVKEIIDKEEMDQYILLSGSSFEEDEKTAKETEGISLIIGDYGISKIKEPIKAGETMLVQASMDCQTIGVMELQGQDDTLQIIHFRSVTLNDNYKEDPKIKKLVEMAEEEYEKGLN
ncbi:MAG: hypothetical protein KKH98_06995 [Spirochaetes bacterium]|nr:hypothetical protein [Spirochaetota bacterium]